MRRAKPSPLRASYLHKAMAILVDADLLARQQDVQTDDEWQRN
jgi:hypothetical protein